MARKRRTRQQSSVTTGLARNAERAEVSNETGMRAVPSERCFRARTELTAVLPIVCPNEFATLLKNTESLYQRPEREAVTRHEAVRQEVSVWARSVDLEAEWLVDRVAFGLSTLHALQASPMGVQLPPVDHRDPGWWQGARIGDGELVRHEVHRATPPYGGMSVREPSARSAEPLLAPAPDFVMIVLHILEIESRRRDRVPSPSVDRILLPVLAWPDVESRQQFQERALQHYDARVTAARAAGFTRYRAAPGLRRHVIWLLQKRVLRLRLEAITDLAQQERDSRDANPRALIDPRSVSREIKKLERLLPL